MKRILSVTLTLVGLLSFLSSCAPSVSPDEYHTLQAELDGAQHEISEMAENLAQLESDYQGLQDNYASLQDNCQSSQASYQKLLERLEQSALMDIPWPELKEFLEQDDTDRLTYVEGSFDCSGFAITLRDNAAGCGIRCAYVEIDFLVEGGHALDAFETTDMGLVYVDSTEADQIAYVKLNEPYGRISLDGVKPECIACSGDPASFWGPLDYMIHSNPFSYSYYPDYQRRVEFYGDSIEAYNKAVEKYNSGSKKWSYDQLTTWLDNIEALKEDLGSAFYQTGDRIKDIEAYWN